MNNSLYTYALAKSIYEQKKDYIDTFCPFVIKIIKESNQPSIEQSYIKKTLEEKYFLNIPFYSLGCIVTRAKRRNLLELRNREITLTEVGNTYLGSLETEKDTSRKINSLLENIKLYFQRECQNTISIDEIKDNLQSFIFRNIEPVLDFFNPSQSKKIIPIRMRDYSFFEKNIIGYVEKIEKSDPTNYDIFKEIVYGSMICAASSCQEIDKLNEKFSKIDIFLDSNFLFSLLKLDYDEINKPIIELYKLLKDYHFNLKVFDFTIFQMKSVLGGYEREYQKYIPGIKVNTIYSSMSTKGFSIQDVKEFISELGDRLKTLGIEIYSTSIDLYTYNSDENLFDKLRRVKVQQDKNIPSESQSFPRSPSLNHDLAVIEEIKKIRGEKVAKLEHSKAFFLTSDLKLARFNYKTEEYGHEIDQTICEVIPDRLLTNILWLRNPTRNKNLPLQSVIAAHSKNLLIDKNLWERFYKTVKTMEMSGEIENKDISLLFYNNRLKEDLLNIKQVDDINKIFIQSEIEKSKEIFETEKREREEKFQKQIDSTIEQKLKDKEAENKKRLEEKYILRAKKHSRILTIVMGLLIIVLYLYLIFLFIKNWFNFLYLVPISLPFFGYAGVFLICLITRKKAKSVQYYILKVQEKIEKKLFNYFYKKFVKIFELGEKE